MKEQETIALILVSLLGGGTLMAVFSKNIILSVVALGIGSIALASLLFILGAPYAGGFELSVGAGLISVLFIITISLTESRKRKDAE
jgi:NADH:ubiquinone oxidoreductase subunit 6 (subunit J)